MHIDDFAEVTPFSPRTRSGIVYVFFLDLAEGRIPLYVGMTERYLARMEDYLGASFHAQTDFKVGKALKYLMETTGHKVVVGTKKSTQLSRDENEVLLHLRKRRIPLLNDLPGYSYVSANKEEQQSKEEEQLRIVQDFCNKHWAAGTKA